MPRLRLAKDVRANCVGDASCPHPGCPIRFAPGGRNRVVLVDDDGRPFCDHHARARSQNYAELHDGYDSARAAMAAAVQAGAMSAADAQYCYNLWDGGPLPDP